MAIEKRNFGIAGDGTAVTAYRIVNESAASITILDYGAILLSAVVPDKNGKMTDVVLGYDRVESYMQNPPYFGATIGRNGNRIQNAEFSINGQSFHLSQNEGRNNLHSGPDGYSFRMWQAVTDEENQAVVFSLESPDQDQGFPGNFHIKVTYTFSDACEIGIHYEGASDRDTVANLTNHSYWNLNGTGSGSVFGQRLRINAGGYTPVDEESIPYGNVQSVEGTPFDFRKMKTIGRDAAVPCDQLAHTGGFDHNFALDAEGFSEAAYAEADESGITLTVFTDQPGIQFYAGNFISGPVGKGGAHYGVHDGFALETQHFPNAVNTPAFLSPVLRAGEKYDTKTVYKLGLR